MWKEFKAFILRGSVLDLAIGVIIGGAFGGVVNSLVNDVIMPPIGLLLGKVNFTSLFVPLDGKQYASLNAAKDAGAATLNYGQFINTIINFLIIAIVIFFVVRGVNRLFPKKAEAPAAVTTKACPYCATDIPIKATRCPHCTSELTA